MDLTVMKNAVTSRVARQVLLGQKHSPALLFGLGVAGVIGTTVLACKATLKLEETLDKHDVHLAQAETKQEQAYVLGNTTGKVIKLYAPAVGLGVISVAALTGSHVILTRRNTALTAAYVAVDRAFREYRERVIDEVGADKERDIRYKVGELEIHDTQKGEVRKIRTVKGDLSQYARVFDDVSSKEWNRDPETNLFFIKCQQNHLNDKLQAKGHVLLNDAYDALGLSRTSAGCVVGWVKGNGDDFIDFGLFRRDNMDEMHSFMIGENRAIWLDINVDGLVYQLLDDQ
jgi:hypothetical protein